MRKVLPILLMLAVAACAGPMTRWVKPGANDEMAAADLTACRYAASDEANRYYTFPLWGYGGRRSSLLWSMRADNDRFFAEVRLTSFCMRSKGYEQIEVRSQNQPPPPPPSPEPPLPR